MAIPAPNVAPSHLHAVRYRGPAHCALERLPIPPLADDEVLIRVRATGICATDIEIFDGVMFYLAAGRTRVPFTPGHEWAGEVVTVGPGVTRFAPGDRVCGECSVGCGVCDTCRRGRYNLCPYRTETGILNRDGAFADHIVFPARSLHACGDLPFDVACLVEPAAVAVYAVKQAGITPADRVVVIGAGPIGLLLVQAARAYGARHVAAVDLVPERLTVARAMGADAAFDARAEDVAGQIGAWDGGQGADVVLEATGAPSAWDLVPRLLGPGARVGIVGLTGGRPASIDFDPYVVADATLRGTVGSPNCWPETIALIRSGRITPARIVTHRRPLAAFDDAVALSRNRTDGAIKVLIEQPA